MRRLAVIVILGVGVAVAAACVRVKPYERETHSKPAMQDPDAVDTSMDEHVHEYREGSVGGSGVGGGGCGCN